MPLSQILQNDQWNCIIRKHCTMAILHFALCTARKNERKPKAKMSSKKEYGHILAKLYFGKFCHYIGKKLMLFLSLRKKCELNNYRPVSLTCSVCKIFESIAVSYTHLTLPTNREV